MDMKKTEKWLQKVGFFNPHKNSSLHQALTRLIPQFVSAAQEEYNAWQQDAERNDEELGSSVICQEIGEQHVFAIAHNGTEAFAIDISPSVYEVPMPEDGNF